MSIFAKYHRRTELREPPGHPPIDVLIVGFIVASEGGSVNGVFIKPDGRLGCDVLDAFTDCRTQPRVMVPEDAMVDGGADIEPGSIIWREKR